MNEFTVGSLFAGIGGFDLGLERAGMRTVWFCEQDEYCRRVLAKHWPGVPCYSDVRALVADTSGARRRQNTRSALGDESQDAGRPALQDHQPDRDGQGWDLPVPVPYVDILVGGFPCQDISLAGAGAGIEGSRSGLWREFARLIRELRPRYVVIENVPAITSRGLDRVLADLAASGFDAEWDHLPASAFGAPHRRDRIWVVAYPGQVFDANEFQSRFGRRHRDAQDRARAWDVRQWLVEPDVGRVAYGVPSRVDRLRCLGNALVPQIAQWIGERIVSYEASMIARISTREAR